MTQQISALTATTNNSLGWLRVVSHSLGWLAISWKIYTHKAIIHKILPVYKVRRTNTTSKIIFSS